MAHRFAHVDKDPYAESVHALANEIVISDRGEAAEAESGVLDALADALVTALGDVAAEAFRRGVDEPQQIAGLARAVAKSSAAVFRAYVGEVDPEPLLRSLATDPRVSDLPQETQETIRREIEKTRNLEKLLLEARRLPALVDYLGSIGLRVDDASLDNAELLVSRHPTPTAGTQEEKTGPTSAPI